MVSRGEFAKKMPSKRRKLESKKLGDDDAAGRQEQLLKELGWGIFAVSAELEVIRTMLGKHLGITGPQWLILMAINDLDVGTGVAVRDVHTKLRVESPFVTTQSKLLEKHGLVRRVSSVEDARVVLMSLTDRAKRVLAELEMRRGALNDAIFSELSERTLREVVSVLSTLGRRLERERSQLASD